MSVLLGRWDLVAGSRFLEAEPLEQDVLHLSLPPPLFSPLPLSPPLLSLCLPYLFILHSTSDHVVASFFHYISPSVVMIHHTYMV